jgi:Bifunctional DNA primase/polymerase, N-terminal
MHRLEPPAPVELAAAVELYAARGWFVFPLQRRSKVPATRRGFLDSSCDLDAVRGWWRSAPEANVGVDCGCSRLLVVDLDGPEGMAAWADLAATAAPGSSAHAPTPVSRTGGGGLQLFFAVSEDADWSRSTVGKLGAKIDTRGLGGYVVLPPSRHPNGRRYRWWLNPNVDPAPAPEWLAERMQAMRVVSPPPGARRRPSLVQQPRRATRYGTKALDGICHEMRRAPESTRHNTLNVLAFRAGRLAAARELDRDEAERLLVDAALLTGLEPADVTRTCRDGIAAGLAAGPAHTDDDWR